MGKISVPSCGKTVKKNQQDSVGTTLSIRIGRQDFKLTVIKGMDPLVYAEVSGQSRKTICINRGYAVRLSSRIADKEHRLGCILQAVANHRCPNDPAKAAKLAAKLRRQMASSDSAA